MKSRPPEVSKERLLRMLNARRVVGGEDECWLWTGYVNTGGYGYLGIYKNGRTLKLRAHRIAHYLDTGGWPVCVCHHCDIPACTNPAHLFPGTRTTNHLDCVTKKRHIYGQRHPGTSLTDDDVRAIRRRYAGGDVRQIDLATEYDVVQQAISHIVTRRNWRHL